LAWKRYENVEELLGAALTKVIMKGITSRDMKYRRCNCSKPNCLANGKCMYNSKYRETCVVYKVKCRLCKKTYIGNTQNFLKKRMQEHMNDMVKQKNKGQASDSFAKHFARHLHKVEISAKDVRPLLKVTTIKRLDPIAASSGFGTDRCQLCMEERIEIASIWLEKGPSRLINKNVEIYGACRHKAKLHVYEKAESLYGTDKGETQKKKRDGGMNIVSDSECEDEGCQEIN